MLVSASGKVYSWGWGLKNKNLFKNDENQITENDVEIEFDINHKKEENINELKNCNFNQNEDANNNFINETNLNLNINTPKDMSMEYIDKDFKDQNNLFKENSIKGKNDNDKYFHTNSTNKDEVQNSQNKNNTKIYKTNDKSQKHSKTSQKNFKNHSNTRISNRNEINLANCQNYETNLFSSSKNYKNNQAENYKDGKNEAVCSKYNPGLRNKKWLGLLNSRNSDMMLNVNFINTEILHNKLITEIASPLHNSEINILCNSNESQKDKLSIPLNTNNDLTFYNKKSRSNLKNKEQEEKEVQNKIIENKKDLDNFFKKDFDFKINAKSTKYIAKKEEPKDNENYPNQVNEAENNDFIMLNEYEKKKQKIIQQIFDSEFLKEENVLNNIKKSFDYTKSPIAIDTLNCRSICNSEDFTLIISKNNSSLFILGNNERNNLTYGKNIFINEPTEYFENIKNKFTLEFEELQNNPETTPEDFANLFGKADEVAKTFFNKMKIVSAKSCGKGFVFIDDKGRAFLITDNFCEKLMDSFPILLNYSNIKFTQVECGKDFCILLSNTGQIYSQGDNKYGQLGIGDFENRSSICEIPNIKDLGIKTVQISCGYKHIVIRASNNKVYTWGNVFLIFYFIFIN
jgi:hypothetical protein